MIDKPQAVHARHLHLVDDPAYRTYARSVIETRADLVSRVLQERIADYLCVELRGAGLAQVTPNDVALMRDRARTLIHLLHEIKAERPPTPYEIAQVEQAKAVTLAKARVRCQASAHKHSLSVWRPDPERPGYELANCDRCQAGVSLHVGQAQESPSEALLLACTPTKRTWRPW